MLRIDKKLTEDLIGPLNSVEQKYAPKQLFVVGHKEILSHGARVSIVGSRQASERGLKEAWSLSTVLAKTGAVIVSGIAEGIDTKAHLAAIEAKGKTVAVLGTPLDQFYPKQNKEIQLLIMRDHLAISQFPPESRVHKSNFPDRNRTMALISDATIIVEAGEKSGTEHQGWEALRLGRPLFIMDWLAEERKLKWVEKLMEYGALLLTSGSYLEVLESIPSRVSEYEPSLPF